MHNWKYCEACRKDFYFPESCIYEHGKCDFCGKTDSLHVTPQEYLPCSVHGLVERALLKYNRRCH